MITQQKKINAYTFTLIHTGQRHGQNERLPENDDEQFESETFEG